MPAHSSTFTTLICILFVIAHLGCDGSSPEAKKTTHRERATSYFEKGQLREALIEYSNVAQADPADADTYYRMALIHLRMGGLTNIQKAFVELSRSLELNKTNRDAQIKLSELYLLGNEPAKAREQADIILVSAPQDKEALVIRGRSLINETRYQEGVTELKKALAFDSKDVGIYLELSRAYFLAKDQAAAEGILQQGLTANPRSTEIMLAMGDFRLATGKPNLAEAAYKQVVETAPENEAAQIRLAGFYQRTNKLAETEGTLQKWASAYPQDERPYIHLGDFFNWLGVKDKALANYHRATELNASSVVARDKLISLYLDAGNLREAEPRIKAILDKNSGDLVGRFFNARMLLTKNNLDEAISLFQTVIKDEPQFAPAHYFLGVAYLKNRQPSQARAGFTQAVKLNPIMPEARTSLAELFLAEGSMDLALEHAQAAMQLNPRNAQAAFIAGDAYLRKGDLVKSKKVYEAIAKALPKEPLGPYRLGLVAHAEKNDTTALAYFEEALAIKPTVIEPMTQIALIRVAQGKRNEARERVIRQLHAAPASPFLHNLLGQLWMASNDTGQAETAFKKAIDLNDSLLMAYMNLGQVYFQGGKTDQAIKEYEAVLAKNPQAIQAHMMLGVIHDSRKEYDQAKSRYEKILVINPRFAPAANNLAWLLLEQGGNLDVAFNYAQTAREQKPDDPSIADTMGWLYYKKNAHLLSASLLKEAAEKLPTNPVVQYHLGMAQYKNGDKAGAKKSFQSALKLSQDFPGSEDAHKILSEPAMLP